MDTHLNDLIEFLRIPSISAQSSYAEDLSRCAQWLITKLETAGLDASLHKTGGFPIVIGKSRNWQASQPTVLIYGHYDVQPPEPFEEWFSPPFEPEIREEKIYARGASDNKGQILAHILGVQETLQRKGALPCNVIFLIEGEEEIGSPSLPRFLEQYQSILKPDIIAISDTGMVKHGVPTLTYALRGVAGLEFVVYGPAYDLHSGIYGGAVVNPLTVAARLVASLHDATWKVAVPGFYDSVRNLERWECDAEPLISDVDIIAQTKAPALDGEAGYNVSERIGARPTAEVNGMGGGYQGEGTKTVLPKQAFVKLTFRLVPDQDPTHILDLVETHLRAHCPKGVKLEIHRGHSGPAYFVDPRSVYGRAAQVALRKTFNQEPVLCREGGSIPILQNLKSVFGADSLLLGLASPDCHAHAPNESLPLENFRAGIRLNQLLLEELAKVAFRGDIPPEDIAQASHIC
ncbi:MAG: dipeptidase [Verrucomicrobia bacterium]|nr:MAG: dipeptidase [Verrucomicrobiota bacterium]